MDHDPPPTDVHIQSENAASAHEPVEPSESVGTKTSLMSTAKTSNSQPEPSSSTAGATKSDEGPNKHGAKKAAPKKKSKNMAKVSEPMEDNPDDEYITVPISNPVSVPQELLHKIPSKLTIDHLRKALIIQEFKLALVQTSFYKMLLPCIGLFKTIMFYQANSFKNETKSSKNTDHDYYFDNQMD